MNRVSPSGEYVSVLRVSSKGVVLSCSCLFNEFLCVGSRWDYFLSLFDFLVVTEVEGGNVVLSVKCFVGSEIIPFCVRN